MGRHMITNPSTGRKVFKTGVLGRKVQKQHTPIKKAVAAAKKPGPDKPKAKTSKTTTCEDMKLLKLQQFRSLANLLRVSPNGSKDALITRISNNNGGGMLATLVMKEKKELAVAAKPKPVAATPVTAKPTKPKPSKLNPVAAKPKPDAAKPKPDVAKSNKPPKPVAAKPKPGAPKPTKPAAAKPKPEATKPGLKKTIEKGKSYHGPGATKRPSPVWKATKKGGTRPSARAMYDIGFTGSVVYDDKSYIMAFRNNGSPYWKPCKDGA